MTLQGKAKMANEVFKNTKNGFLSCEYRKKDELLVYSFSDKDTAHSFLLEQQMNFEGNKGITILIDPENSTQILEKHKKETRKTNKDESKIEIKQEDIDRYTATNEEFWDAFYNGSQNANYSLFKDLKIDSKEDLIDSTNADQPMIDILCKLFKHTLLKGEFYVAHAEEKLILTNYRLLVLGASDLNIPLSKISNYGAEGNFFVVKYLKNGEEKSVTLSHYIDETLVNSVIEAKEFKDLDSKQNAIIESAFSTNTGLNKPNYEIPSISQKMKNNRAMYKLFGTIFIIPLFIGLWGLNWLNFSNPALTEEIFWPRSICCILIIGFILRWLVFLFKKNSFIGGWFKILSLVFPIFTIIEILMSTSSTKATIHGQYYSFDYTLGIGFFLTLVTSVIFVIMTFKLNK